ncbi:MAG TPA: hypothetical protein VGM02_02985 [Acidobacteriaceae bacterium]
MKNNHTTRLNREQNTIPPEDQLPDFLRMTFVLRSKRTSGRHRLKSIDDSKKVVQPASCGFQ